MPSKKVELIIALIVGVLLGSIIGYTTLHKKQPVKPKVIVKKQVVVKTKYIKAKTINKEKLAEWIYKHSFRCSRKQSDIYAQLLLKTKHPLLFAAMIARESNFNSTAYSKAGAIGLMQVLPTKDHMKQLKDAGILTEPRDLFNPDTNIAAGEFIFDDILRIKKNNVSKALLMYCGGNRQYVHDVLEYLGQLSIAVGFEDQD